MHKDTLYQSDLGDGRYQNPVLFADYSDPDVICVGGRYYLTASSFNFVPGLPILTSGDLVNWTLAAYALDALPARYAIPRHAAGVWAPAIRHHGGLFHIFYGMPDEGIFMVRATNPLGPWEKPICVLSGKGLIDPCPFWDADGHAWIVHGYARSRIGFKSFLGLFPMAPDGTAAIGPDRLLYDGRAEHPTIEGPKVYRRGEYLYIFAPAGGVETGWQTVLRAQSISGPFEARVVLRQGDTATNGPHQGAWVHTPAGEDWFVHFQSRGLYGRVVHLQPLRWTEDGWPVIGNAREGERCGTPYETYRKPAAPSPARPLSLAASDAFAGDSLSLLWQFMGNARPAFYSLTARPGALRLYAFAPPDGRPPTLWRCPQALTQKIVCPAFTASVRVDFAGLSPGEQAGLALVGGQYAFLAVRRDVNGTQLVLLTSQGEGRDRRETLLKTVPLQEGADTVSLQMTLTPRAANEAAAQFAFAYRRSDAHTPIGPPFIPSRHTWVGAKAALLAMRYDGTATNAGHADFTAYHVAPIPPRQPCAQEEGADHAR